MQAFWTDRVGFRGNPCENSAMFTGIITGVGRIVEVCPLGEGPAHGVRLSIEAASYAKVRGAASALPSAKAAARSAAGSVTGTGAVYSAEVAVGSLPSLV